MLLIKTLTHMQGFVLRCVSLASYWHQNVKQYNTAGNKKHKSMNASKLLFQANYKQ